MEKEGKKGERNETEKKGESVKEEEVEKRKEKKRGTRKEGKGREGTSKERKKKKDEGKRREKEEEVDEKNGEEEIKKDLEIETPSKVAITLTLSDLIERVGMTEEALLQRIITLQRFFRSCLMFSRLKGIVTAYRDCKTSLPDRRRFCVLAEMLETERSYVSSLRECITEYLVPMKQSSLLPPSEVAIIFGNLQEIFAANGQVLEKLTAAQKAPPGKESLDLLGEVFSDLENLRDPYTQYILGYNKASETLKNCLKNKDFRAEMRKMNKKVGGARDLGHFLIMPVQRLPRYQLLLNELAKHTPKERVDYNLVTNAFRLISEAAKTINERQKMSQDVGAELEKIDEFDRVIEESIGSVHDWKSQNGWLQLKGSLMLDCIKATRALTDHLSQEYVCYLFPHSLLIGRKNSSSLISVVRGKSDDKISSPSFSVSKCIIWEEIVDARDGAKQFEVIVLQNGILKPMKFYTTSDESATQWASAFLLLKGTKYVLDQEPPWSLKSASNLLLTCNKVTLLTSEGEKVREGPNYRIKVRLGDQHHSSGFGSACKTRLGNSIGDEEIIKISVSCSKEHHERMGEMEMTVFHARRNWRRKNGEISVHSLFHHKHQVGLIELSMELKSTEEKRKRTFGSAISTPRLMKMGSSDRAKRSEKEDKEDKKETEDKEDENADEKSKTNSLEMFGKLKISMAKRRGSISLALRGSPHRERDASASVSSPHLDQHVSTSGPKSPSKISSSPSILAERDLDEPEDSPKIEANVEEEEAAQKDLLSALSEKHNCDDERVMSAIVTIQRFIRFLVMKQRLKQLTVAYKECKDSLPERRRFCVLAEIFDTEKSYVSSLAECLKVYFEPMKTSGLLNENEMITVFNNLEDVYQVNKQVLEKLDTAMKAPPGKESLILLGEVFLYLDDLRDPYTRYILGYNEATSCLKKHMKKKSFRLEMRKMDKQVGGARDLSHFLIMPVQRLPRYQLLLNELSKHTPKERVDHGMVTKSLEQIAEAAKQINERQKMTQDVGVELEKVEDIDRVIEEAAGSRQDWKSQNGWLQHKGTLLLDRIKATRVLTDHLSQEYVCYLFPRSLLVTRKNSYSILSDTGDLVAAKCFTWDHVVDVKSGSKEFEMIVLQNGILKLLEFYTTSDESTSQWVSAFNLLKGTKYVLDQEPPWTTASNLVLKCNKIAKQGEKEKTSEPSNFRIKVKLGDQRHTFRVGDSCKVRIGSSIGDDEIIKISVSCDHEKMGEIEMTVLHVKRNWRKNLDDMSVHSLIHHKHKTGSIELSMELKAIEEKKKRTGLTSSRTFSTSSKFMKKMEEEKDEKEEKEEKDENAEREREREEREKRLKTNSMEMFGKLKVTMKKKKGSLIAVTSPQRDALSKSDPQREGLSSSGSTSSFSARGETNLQLEDTKEEPKAQKKVVDPEEEARQKALLLTLEERYSCKGDVILNAVLAIQRFRRFMLMKQRLKQLTVAYKECKDSLPERRRFCVLAEILDTEKSYVSSLAECLKVYFEPMKTSGLLNENEMITVFNNLEDVYQVNKQVLEKLDTAMKAPPGKESLILLGEVFLYLNDLRDPYTRYILGYNEATSCLKKHMKKKSFRLEMRKMDKQVGGARDLSHFLIMPVQRLPRYQLLLNELSKHTPKERVDHGFVTKSLEQIAEVAKQINERQKMTQDVGVELEKVEDIDRVIEEAAGSRQDWKSQNGWLQHKGTLLLDRIKATRVLTDHLSQEYVCYLFPRSLLITRKNSLMMSMMGTNSTSSATKCYCWEQVVDIQDRDKEFGVMVLQNGILKLLEFYTTSDESTSQWVSAFNLLKGTKYVLDQEPPWTTASNLVLKCNKIAKQGEKTSEPSNFRIKVKLGDQHHTFGVGDSCKVRIGSSIGDDEIIKISVSCDHEKMGEIEMTVLHVKRNWRKNLGDMSVHSLIHHKHKTGSIELSMKLKKIKENAEGKTAVQSSVSFSRMLKGKSFTTDDKEEKEKEREKEKEKEEQVEMRASSFF